MKLSNQAKGALMIALQKGILEQMDITEMLGEFDFYKNEENELAVKNPPSFEVNVDTEDA